MPTGARIRTDNVFGTTTDNPLTNVAATMNSAGLANLAAVSSNHAVIVLDPQRTAGAPEIVIVTAHTAAATSATITRGAYGTAARQHAAGTLWVHAPTREDFIQILTSATRPSDPYKGQGIFETDTNKVAFYTGTDWAYRDAGGYLGFASRTTNQGSVTTEVDFTSLSVTVTVATGRRLKIIGYCPSVSNSSANAGGILTIKESTTRLQVAAIVCPVAAFGLSLQCTALVFNPSAGSHTYKLTVTNANGGTATFGAAADAPSFIVVEDIGAF